MEYRAVEDVCSRRRESITKRRPWTRRSFVATIAILGTLLTAERAAASETLTYTYDARGRLVKVARSGTINNGTSACYAYDKADNRSDVTTKVSADCSAVAFSIASNGAVTEGGTSVFTITKTGSAATSVSVNYATANGTAVAPGDYTAKSGTLTFTTTQTSQTVSVVTTDDAAVESTETFSMSLSTPTGGATIATGTATATINDNDAASPTCNGISFAAGDMANLAGDPLVFTVTKSGSTSASCNVNYATANGTAVAGTDYIATSGTLTFTSAQATNTVTVPTIDRGSRFDKTLYLNLSAPSGGSTISDAQAVGTIVATGSGGCTNCLQNVAPASDSTGATDAAADQPPATTTDQPSDSAPPEPPASTDPSGPTR
jgi:YD repeat-containing protein